MTKIYFCVVASDFFLRFQMSIKNLQALLFLLSPVLHSPLERGWRKAKEGTPGPPKVPLRQEVVSVTGQRRGQRIAVPVKKLFAREKRPYGLGMVGKLTNRTYRKRIDSYVKRQIEDMDDHRYSTYTCT